MQSCDLRKKIKLMERCHSSSQDVTNSNFFLIKKNKVYTEIWINAKQVLNILKLINLISKPNLVPKREKKND